MKANSSTKRSLIISILALCMCFAMLIGTTFAWFTDSVTSTGNVIKSGTLDVGFYWAKGTEDPTTAEWTDASKGALFSEETLWEPGYAETKHIKITNEGSLALAYKLAIIPHGEVSELADVIDVYYYDDKGAVQQTNRIVDNHDDPNYVGTLREFINRGIAEGNLASETEYTATFVFKMHDEAGNEYQNKSIGSDFSIQLLATQWTAEKDSFDEKYDVNAFTTVSTVEGLRNAINSAVDTTTIFVQAGEYNVGSVLVIEGKSINIVGLGVVNFNVTGKSHLFTVQDSTNPESDMKVTIKNLNIDGKNVSKNLFMVKYNVVLDLVNVDTKNAGWADICIDNANAYGDKFYDNTETHVNLYNSNVKKVSMDTLPVVDTHPYKDAGVTTYAYLTYDDESSVQIIEKQEQTSTKADTMYVNGDNSDPIGITFLVDSDEELAAVLQALHTNSEYWNKQTRIKLAAGEYSGNYTINQYPQWNGVHGKVAENNYTAGVPANAPVLKLTIVGETVSTFARGAASIPTAIFTGSVTVNGFGNSDTGFTTSNANPAPITFKNVGFDGADITPDANGDVVVFKAMSAVDNLFFEGCYFANATHITLGSSNYHNMDTVKFTDCTFDNGGCLSGYFKELTVTGANVIEADNGFINAQNTATVTVTDIEANVGKYFLRTKGAGTYTVTDGNISLYESDGSAHLVHFRGSNETLSFADVVLPEKYTTEGVDENSTFSAVDYYDIDGVTYVKDMLTGVQKLYLVPEEYTADTVVVAEGTEVIGNYAFAYNNNVKTVILASTVRDLGRGFDSSNVEKVVLNEGLEVISSRAFRSTLNLKEVVFSSTVTEIADDAFQKTGLKTIVIPASVEYIGVQAFGASKIENVTIEGNVTMNNKAFRGCSELKTFTINGDDINFINVNSGSGNCWICNSESNNKGTSHITFNLKNPIVKDKVYAAMGADVTTNVFNCDIEVEEDGTWTENGKTCIMVKTEADLIKAIKDKIDVIYVAAGTYNLRFTNDTTFNVDGLTIKAMTNNTAKFNITSSEVSYGRIQGDNVTFEGINFTNATVGATGKATYNNCTFDGRLEAASSNKAETYANNCTMASFHTSTDMNAGNAYLTNCVVTEAAYNTTATITFTNCEIGTMSIWGGTTVLENSKVDLNNIVLKGDANKTLVLNGATYVSDGFYKDAAGNCYAYNAAGLAAMNKYLKNNGTGHAIWGRTFNIMADIDASDIVWESVWLNTPNNDCVGFTIDGHGHTISNLTINGSAMFYQTANGKNTDVPTTIKNLTFDGATVTGGYHTGIIWGQMYGDVAFENVHIKNSTVTGTCNVGAFIGRNGDEGASNVSYKNCSVTNTTITATGAGDPNGASVFQGSALTIGTSVSANITFENCTQSGNTVTSADGQVGGGIYAWWNASTNATGVVNGFENYN